VVDPLGDGHSITTSVVEPPQAMQSPANNPHRITLDIPVPWYKGFRITVPLPAVHMIPLEALGDVACPLGIPTHHRDENLAVLRELRAVPTFPLLEAGNRLPGP